MVTLINFTDEEVRCYYQGIEYTVPARHSVDFRDDVAYHLLTHRHLHLKRLPEDWTATKGLRQQVYEMEKEVIEEKVTIY
jgi:hypothetical protein